jgi:2-(1,2-epoxy-1,2-dihydrophenyl)acetyl-CoA isomerase
MQEDLVESCEAGIAILRFNRPERLNAFSPDMLARLGDALLRLASNQDVRVVILTGTGRGFCAGGDVKRMAGGTPPQGTAAVLDLRRKMEVSRLLHEMPKPTIAMVNGVAAGAGLSLALACDVRFAARSARFTTAFGKIGLSGDFGGSYFLTKIVGTAKARELYFASDILDAGEALEMGLVNRVIAEAELEAETIAWARKLAAGSPEALARMKHNLNLAIQGTLSAVFDEEAAGQIEMSATKFHRESAERFARK